MPRILIIDDNEDLRGLLREVLERDGAEVFEAEDGIQGLERFKDCQPEMVIVDVLMPGKGGLEVLKEVREKSQQVKILGISGSGEEETDAPCALERTGCSVNRFGIRNCWKRCMRFCTWIASAAYGNEETLRTETFCLLTARPNGRPVFEHQILQN